MSSSPEVTAQTEALEGVFTLLGTPIGNLGDLSRRASQTLLDADVIAAEDTRRLRVLLSHLQIAGKEMLSVDANREEHFCSKVVELVRSGKTVVYTTDAGMPGISDPGAKLVKAVSSAGLRVDAVPGPSASILAASLSGFCESGFLFPGFLSVKQGPRKRALDGFATCGLAIVLFESPKRVAKLLEDAQSVYGPGHSVFLGRELTKLHQELFYGTIEEAISRLGSVDSRGEFAVVLAPKLDIDSPRNSAEILELVVKALGSKVAGTKVLASELAEITGVKRTEVYDMLIELRRSAASLSD